jgi:hypothetical protein
VCLHLVAPLHRQPRTPASSIHGSIHPARVFFHKKKWSSPPLPVPHLQLLPVPRLGFPGRRLQPGARPGSRPLGEVGAWLWFAGLMAGDEVEARPLQHRPPSYLLRLAPRLVARLPRRPESQYGRSSALLTGWPWMRMRLLLAVHAHPFRHLHLRQALSVRTSATRASAVTPLVLCITKT